MQPSLIESITPRGILSFGPAHEAVKLTPLNVIIGPNGSGKSNLIELFELLKAAPTDLAAAIRDGGGVGEWIWKGSGGQRSAAVEAELHVRAVTPALRYKLQFESTAQNRLEISDELLENVNKTDARAKDVYFYYRYQNGRPTINTRTKIGKIEGRKLDPDSLDSRQSVLSQRRDPDAYPELTSLAQALGEIQIFREWSFGRSAMLRQPQPADLASDLLLPDLRNLGLVLNDIEHSDTWSRFNGCLKRFLPRFERLSIRVTAGTVQVFLHEAGLSTPIPATRLSDGTIRFIALLAILLGPSASSLICLEEPELGLHPDALSLIAELLVEKAADVQLVVTTQSDVLVSALSEHADSILVCEHRAAETQLERLPMDKLEFWLKKYQLGELWRIGELGGNP